MAKQTINIGASPNDGTGTPLRTSFDYCNLNFTELYTAVGPSGNNIVCPGSATITGALGAAGLNVTGATIPANGVYLGSANNLSFSAASTLGMTLNATGLGVGGVPSGTNRFLIFNGATQALTLDTSGNLGIGVTPVYKLDTYTRLQGSVSEKRFANRTSNNILVKRYFSILADTALFSIECGTAGASNMAAFEINVFATGTKVGISSDRQFYGKFYVTRNLAGTFTITSAFSSGSSGAFTVTASGTSLNVNGIFSVISDGSACVEITGYIGGRDTIDEANLTVTMP